MHGIARFRLQPAVTSLQQQHQSIAPCTPVNSRKQLHRGFCYCSKPFKRQLVAYATAQHAQAEPSSTQRQQPQQADVPDGLLRMPGVTSPQAFIKCWSQQTRPRLEALWSSIQRSSNPERVLMALDDLLMQLRSSRSLAVHIQQQHVEAKWRAAAAQVAADCHKYETYVLRSKSLANKLAAICSKLQQADLASNSTHVVGQQQQEHQREQGTQYVLPVHQLLQLCRVLSTLVNDQLPQDSLSWLAALELSDPNAVMLKQLQQQEQELIAAIDHVMSEPALMRLPRPLHDLLAATQQQSQASGQADAAATASSSSVEQDEHSRLVFLTRGLLAKLLQQCEDGTVRRQVYMEVLQPKLAEAAALLDRLARCRQQRAHITGHESYLEMTEMRLVTDRSASAAVQEHDSSSTVDLLLQVAVALQPLAQQQVEWVLQQQQPTAVQLGHQEGSCAQQQCQQEQYPLQEKDLQQSQESQQPDCTGLPTSHSTNGPWDWDYLLHQAQQPYLNTLRDPTLQQHLNVDGVLAGFSSLLQQWLGVQLVVRPAGDSETWSPHVRALLLVRSPISESDSIQTETGILQQQQVDGDEVQLPAACPKLEVLGTIYLDVGGGYGCRMLRYSRHQGNSSSEAGATSADMPLQQQLAAAPAVAVGLSGVRTTLQASHGTPTQHRLLQEAQDTVDEEQQLAASSTEGGSPEGMILSVSQLWEFGHEMGHALHLILSSRQPACHLSGRFVAPSLLEVPSQLMERLFTYPDVLAQLCQHHKTQEPLPVELAQALAAYYGCRYNSALAMMARVATGLAEQMYGQFGGDGEDYWRRAWEAVAGLPDAVASNGCLRELSLLPVMAAHPGTYHCYITSWCIAAHLCDTIFKPPAVAQGSAADLSSLRQEAFDVFKRLNAASWAGLLLRSSRQKTSVQKSPGRSVSLLDDIVMLEGSLQAKAVQNWVWHRTSGDKVQ